MTKTEGSPAKNKGGRPKGSLNKKTSLLVQAVAAKGITPLEFLLKVMRDSKRKIDVRIDAAKAAAPYVHSKLATIEHTGKGGGPMQTVTRIELVPLSKE